MRHINLIKCLYLVLAITWILNSQSISFVLAQTEVPNDADRNSIYLPAIPNNGQNSIVTIEGTVELVTSTYQGEFIVSRATVLVESILAGEIDEERVVIFYFGGTVGDVTLRVSHEPVLWEGMQVRATLQHLHSEEYEIKDVDEDLEILSEGIQPSYVLYGVTWPDSSIPVPLQINANTADVAGTGEQQAVVNAINTWNAVSNSDFAFQSTTSSCAPTADDDTNCIVWQSGPASGDTVGVAQYWYINRNIVEVDIIFYEQNGNGAIQWSINPTGNQTDVESVALHELGHALGLGHSNVAGAVMGPTLDVPTRRALHNDDIAGIVALYPSTQLTTAYVATTGSATGSCTATNKCKTIARGVSKVANNGTVLITAGNYPESVTINRPMTLHSEGGIVTIGQ